MLPTPHLTLHDLLANKEYYRQEEDWKALLRKLYCRLFFDVVNNSSSAQTVQLFGGFTPNAAETRLSSDLQSQETYVSVQTVTISSGLTTVFALAQDTGQNYVWVFTNRPPYLITVLNAATREVVTTVSPGFGSQPTAGAYKSAASGTGGMMYLPFNGPNTVVIYDTATFTVLGTITGVGTGGEQITDIAYSTISDKFYVANLTTGEVIMIQNDVVTTLINVGVEPRSLLYNPDTNCIYALSQNAGSPHISIIDCATDTVVSTLNFTAGNIPQSMTYNAQQGIVYVASDNGATTWLNSISSANVLTEFIYDLDGAAQIGYTNGNLYATNATTNSVIVVNGSSSSNFVTLYSISVNAGPNKIMPMVVGTIYVTQDHTVEVLDTEVTITGSENFNFIQRDTTYNPILVKHTHLYFPNTSQLRNAFSLNMSDSGGDSWSLLMPMRQYSSGAQPNQQVQECFAYNEILFDGRQSLSFTINAHDRMFLEFYYVQANIPDLLRKKLLSDTGLYWNKQLQS